MALNQRRVKILDLIREDGHAKVQELSRMLQSDKTWKPLKN